MAEEVDSALSCQVNALLLSSVNESNAKLDKLQVTLIETSDLGGQQLQQQVEVLAQAVTTRAEPWAAAPEPLQPLGASEQDAAAVQDALQGGLEKVRSMTEAATRLLEQLGQVGAVLQSGVDTARVWAVLQTARQHRWHNSRSPLVSLPTEVLHTIVCKAGKGARRVCFALRHAFSTPGVGIHLPPADPDQPMIDTRFQSAAATAAASAAAAAAATARLGTRIARWPHPQGVTKLTASAPLELSACTAISAAFPNLQEVALPGWVEGAHMALPPSITSMARCAAPPCPKKSFLLEVVSGHFTALQSLSLSSCPQDHMSRLGLSALTQLAQLSSLALTTQDATYGTPMRGAWGSVRPDKLLHGLGLGVWGTLGALPRLARLCLDVPLEFHSDMPQVAPLPALTHLKLRCSIRMVQRDERRGVAVPVLQVLRLLPVPLASLHLLSHRKLTSDPSAASRALVAQAVCRLAVRSMVLKDTPSYIEELAPFLPLSLTSFTTSSTVELTPAAIGSLFPHPLPAASSLDIVAAMDEEAEAEAEAALQLLGEQLPRLTRLTVRTMQLGGPGAWARDMERSQREALVVASDLSQLSKLQQLSISGWSLARFLAPALSTLPALTMLDLNTYRRNEAFPLQLRRLRSLHLILSSDRAVEYLEGVRQMDGLTELVLSRIDVPYTQRDANLWLLAPPPASLQRLVLPEKFVAEARGALEGYAVDIVSL